MVGQVALDFGQEENFPNTTYHCATDLDLKAIEKEERNYVELPKFYNFGSAEERERKLQQNFTKVYNEVDEVVNDYV